MRSAVCPPGAIITTIKLRSGAYIDYVSSIVCTSRRGIETIVTVDRGNPDVGRARSPSSPSGFSSIITGRTTGLTERKGPSRDTRFVALLTFGRADGTRTVYYGRGSVALGPPEARKCPGDQVFIGLRVSQDKRLDLDPLGPRRTVYGVDGIGYICGDPLPANSS